MLIILNDKWEKQNKPNKLKFQKFQKEEFVQGTNQRRKNRSMKKKQLNVNLTKLIIKRKKMLIILKIKWKLLKVVVKKFKVRNSLIMKTLVKDHCAQDLNKWLKKRSSNKRKNMLHKKQQLQLREMISTKMRMRNQESLRSLWGVSTGESYIFGSKLIWTRIWSLKELLNVPLRNQSTTNTLKPLIGSSN